MTPERDELRFLSRESRAPRIRSRSEFAEAELIIPDGPYAGRRFRPNRQPFANLLFGALDEERWRRRCITGPSQSGKTLCAFALPTMYHLFERNETVVLGLPSLDMCSDKWEQDLRPAIEASRYRELLPRRGPGSRGGTPDSITFLNGATLKFMTGGGSDKVRAGFTSRVVIVTETDGMDTPGMTSRESDKVRQLEARTRAWGERAELYLECTVSLTSGRTWQEYSAGTASRIVKPCPYCKQWVQPEREHLQGWKHAENELAAGDAAYFVCPECSHKLTEANRRIMVEKSKLLHRGQSIDKRGRIRGTPHRTRTLGFRWSAFDNLFVTAEQLGADEWTADRASDRDESQKAVKQFIWCIPVADETIEADRLGQSIVIGQHTDFQKRLTGLDAGEVFVDCQGITVGIDCGRRRLHWEVNAWSPIGREVIEYGEQPNDWQSMTTEQAIADSLRKLYRRFRDHPYACPIGVVLVDAGHWGSTVRETCRQIEILLREERPEAYDLNRRTVWNPSHGIPGYRHPPKTNQSKQPSKSGEPWYLSRQAGGIKVVNFDPNYWKAVAHDSWRIQPTNDNGEFQKGCVRLFGSDPYWHAEFGSHITAEEFQRSWDAKRGWVETWVKVRKENHWLDTDVLNIVAGSILFDRPAHKRSGEWFANQKRR